MNLLKTIWRGIRRALREVWGNLWDIIIRWPNRFLALIREIRAAWGKPRRRHGDCCVTAAPETEVRADPLIYCQTFLMSQGLAVTWDNPDINLIDGTGKIVGAHAIAADTNYQVRVRVWNGSLDGPAPSTLVSLSYLTFGINTASTDIANQTIDVPSRGAPGHPVSATFSWHTPTTPGHYCLQAKLDYFNDANPNNNLGQKNLTISQLRSPAEVWFPIRNEFNYRRRFNLTVDTYKIPPVEPCPTDHFRSEQFSSRLEEAETRWRIARSNHSKNGFPLPEDWHIEWATGSVQDLGPNETVNVHARITAPVGFSGSETLNINAMEGNHLIGGITVLVQSA